MKSSQFTRGKSPKELPILSAKAQCICERLNQKVWLGYRGATGDPNSRALGHESGLGREKGCQNPEGVL